MALTVTHTFVSAKPDGGDATLIQPSNWNDDHDFSGTLEIANGGTGANNAASARTALGLGTLATQAADNVAITGGSMSGVTITTLDSNTTFKDNIDATKQMQFQLSALQTGQTTIVTLPNENTDFAYTLVTEETAQTLSNKTFVAPVLGVATGTSFNTITGIDATLPLAPADTALAGTSTVVAHVDHVHPTNFTATATDIKMDGVQAVGVLTTFPRADHVHPTDTTRAATSGTLAQFAATTSAQLAGVISDETGTGSLVFATSPSLTTPTLGVATATTINKVTLTAPATASTLTIADGKTLTASNTLTLSGTDSSTLNIGTGGTLGTAAYTASTAYAPAAGSSSITTVGALNSGSITNGFGAIDIGTDSLTAGSATFGSGTLPSAQDTAVRTGALIGNGGMASADTRLAYLGNCEFGGNFYYNAGWKYIGTGYSSRISFLNDSGNQGTVVIDRAVSGTAGNAISFSPLATFSSTGLAIVSATTASAANVYQSASGTELLRSTSSLRYKRDVETLDATFANNVLDLRPVWYRSKATADKQEWSYYGLIAEEVALIEPRLVHWVHRDTKQELSSPAVAASPAELDAEGVEITPAIAAKEAQYKTVIDTDSPLIPDGVQYERLSVLLLDVVKRQQAQLAAFEARLAALEAV